jgi:hypothetical protein
VVAAGDDRKLALEYNVMCVELEVVEPSWSGCEGFLR